MIATFMSADCPRCPEPILRGEEIVPQGDGYIHARCASGQDETSALPVKKTAAKKEGASKKSPVPHVEPATTAGQVMEIPDIPADGLLIHDLHEPTYHSHPGSVSVSGLKLMRQAPALYDWQRRHPPVKKEFDYGSAAHLYVLGVGPEIVELQRRDADTGVWSVAADRRSPSVAEHDKAIRAAGKLPLLAKEHEQVKEMAEQIRAHSFAMKLLEKGTPEVSGFMVDPDTGVLRRGRADHLRKRVIVDYKSAANADPNKLHKVAHDNGWYMQAPFYQRLFSDLTGVEITDFLFIVQQKTAPYLVSVVQLEQKAMDLGARHCDEAMQQWRDCTESGHWPGYQADGVIKTLQLPKYAFDVVREA